MNKQRIAKTVGLLGALCVAGYSAIAGSAFYDFNTDPTSILKLYGNAQWYNTGGSTITNNLSPVPPAASNGFLSITDAQNSQRSAIVFDDFDNGLVVKAFNFSMDVRIGGGTASPADGISINYVRANDPVLPSNGGDATDGWATGPNGEADLPEEGATTGLGIGFDAWYSGGDGSWGNNRVAGPVLNANGTYDVTDDVIGVSVRLDGNLIYQFAMPTENGTVTDLTSLQTGPLNPNVDPNDITTSWALLGWAPVSVSLAEDGTLKVSYKGSEVTPAGGLHTTFAPSAGRLVLVGRTGGANQNNHIDNINITTVPATTPSIGPVTSVPNGFSFLITDAGTIAVDPTTVTLKLNGAALAAPTAVKTTNTTAVTATTTNLIPAGSTNTVVASFKASDGNTYTATRTFVEGPYAVIPASFALPSGAVDTTKPGFQIRAYETVTDNQTSLALTEEELHGWLGASVSDPTLFTDNGFYDETGVINYARISLGDGQQGNFGGETEIPGFPNPQNILNGYDHAALEIMGYAYFPAAGTYTWGCSSDDGFRVSAAPSVAEKVNTVQLGQYDGGRGSSVPGTLFTFYVNQAGYYPIRTIYQNGGGGANIELFSVQPDGTYALLNDTSTAGAIKFYRASSKVLPYLTSARPEPGLFAEGRTVNANEPLQVILVDGSSATIDQASIKLSLNGTALTPTVTKSGTSTTIAVDDTVNLLPVGTNTASLTYTAGGGTPVTESWQFIVSPYAVLDPSLASPVGSGDPAHPGFRVKTWQLDITSPTVGTAGGNQALNLVSFAEQELLGLFGPNVANLAGFTGGYYYETGVINYDKDPTNDGAQGNFGNDAPTPGIPGAVQYSGPTDNYALEIQSYVEFPTAGLYTFGVNSDDGFATYESTGPAPLFALNINTPTAIAGRMGAVSSGTDEGGIGLPLPTTPITGKVVYANPPLADSAIVNVADVSNNIVLIDRGTVTFTAKLQAALAAGAKAVIVVNNRDETSTDGILPLLMTGTDVAIPAVMVNIHDGQKIKDHLADPGGVTVSLGQDPTTKLGVANYGKGASDVLFAFKVPTPGVYPIRTVYFEGGGGASVEIFSVANDGTKILLNDNSTAGALKSYSAVIATAKPTISVAADGTITFTGTLTSSSTVNGTYTPVVGATSPFKPTFSGNKFYRSSISN